MIDENMEQWCFEQGLYGNCNDKCKYYNTDICGCFE